MYDWLEYYVEQRVCCIVRNNGWGMKAAPN
ncbi:hypothetical protein F0726_01590 [Acidithiobacillus caldus]|nr:hypothetical protein F0726_01590 [Acidithiobacillus caldus]